MIIKIPIFRYINISLNTELLFSIIIEFIIIIVNNNNNDDFSGPTDRCTTVYLKPKNAKKCERGTIIRRAGKKEGTGDRERVACRSGHTLTLAHVAPQLVTRLFFSSFYFYFYCLLLVLPRSGERTGSRD